MLWHSVQSEAGEGASANGWFLEAPLASHEVQLNASNYPIKPRQQEPAFAWPLVNQPGDWSPWNHCLKQLKKWHDKAGVEVG